MPRSCSTLQTYILASAGEEIDEDSVLLGPLFVARKAFREIVNGSFDCYESCA